jgi:nucleotide-binding universal stress UspA family protein
MSVLRTDIPHPSFPAQQGRAESAMSRKRKVLAVVDGSARTVDVLEFLVAQAEGSAPNEVVVLNVQPLPEDWRLRGYGSFMRGEIRDRLINDRGRPIVTSAAVHLERAGIAHKERVEIGESAETIERCAREESCEQIVMAEPRSGALRRWLARRAGITIGSVVSQLLELAERPVVVVR